MYIKILYKIMGIVTNTHNIVVNQNNQANKKEKILFKEITDVTHTDFIKAMSIYEEAFPLCERHHTDIIKKRTTEKLNQMYVGCLKDDVVFMALLYPIKKTQFILLDYRQLINSIEVKE